MDDRFGFLLSLLLGLLLGLLLWLGFFSFLFFGNYSNLRSGIHRLELAGTGVFVGTTAFWGISLMNRVPVEGRRGGRALQGRGRF